MSKIRKVRKGPVTVFIGHRCDRDQMPAIGKIRELLNIGVDEQTYTCFIEQCEFVEGRQYEAVRRTAAASFHDFSKCYYYNGEDFILL